jgi:DNA polymerase elongation subunit (family B)
MQVLTWDVRDEEVTKRSTKNMSYDEKKAYKEACAKMPSAKFTMVAIGIGSNGESCSMQVHGFKPYFYIKLPPVNVGTSRVTNLVHFLQGKLRDRDRNEMDCRSCVLEHYYTYHGYQWETKQPFLKLVFHSDRCRKQMARIIEKGFPTPRAIFPELEHNPDDPSTSRYLFLQLFESNCEAMVRFFHERELNPCGWVELRPGEYIVHSTPSAKVSRAHMEVSCQASCVHPSSDQSIGKIMLASFDIEADSSHGDFPVATKDYTKPANELIQVFLSQAQSGKLFRPRWVEYCLKHMFGLECKARGLPENILENLSRAYVSTAPEEQSKLKALQWSDAATAITSLLTTATAPDLHEGDVVNVHTPGKASTEKDVVVEVRVREECEDVRPVTQYHREYLLKKAKVWVNLVDPDGTRDRHRKCIARENGFRPYSQMTSLEWGRRKKRLHAKLNRLFKSRFPKLQGDKVIQIGTVFWRYGESEPCLRHIITMDTCDPIEGVVVESFATEAQVLTRWSEVMRLMAPNIVTGYNIFGFDYKFMWERADCLGVAGEFGDLSSMEKYSTTIPHRLHKTSHKDKKLLPGRKAGDAMQCRCDSHTLRCKLLEKELTSAGLGENRMYYMDVPGMVQIDMLKDIMKDHNLSSYKLDDVASNFIHGKLLSFEHVASTGDADACAEGEMEHHEGASDAVCELRTTFTSDNAYGITTNDYVHLYRMSVIGREPVENDQKFRVERIEKRVDGKGGEAGEGGGGGGCSYTFTLNAHVPSLQSDESYVWGIGKDDVSPQDIFRMQKEGPKERATIGKYCIQDCQLVLTLMMKLQTVSNNLGMSRVCSVPFQYIFTRGQGIKTYSLLSRECRARDYRIPHRRSDGLDPRTMTEDERAQIVENGYPKQSDEPVDEKETYQGAFVLDPKPGIYLEDAIAVLDYSSLYPSSIISHNLCASTIVLDPEFLGDAGAKRLHAKGLAFRDVSYDNYVSVRRGVTYEKRRNEKEPTTTCRFIQPKRDAHDKSIQDMDRGILPQTLRILLSQRKATRAKIKTEKDPFVCAVLDGLQLAYKVTANSVYGSLGATTNPIFFKDIAASTTATGREMLLFAKEFVTTKFPGSEIVYGDTDSIFINFHPKDADGHSLTGQEGLERTIQLGIEAGEMATAELQDVRGLAPQDLEYEKTFYPFILLSKKRYAAIKYEHNPKKGKLNYMGIVLKRRDNAPIVKVMYADVLDAIMNARSITQSIKRLRADIEQLIAGNYPLDYLVISKSLRSHYDNPDQIVHKVLADRMAERDPGNKPQANDRIPYAYIDVGNRQIALQGERVEHPDYIVANNLRTDATFYITNQISKPIAQIYALVLEQLPGYKHKNDPHYFEKLRRKYRDEGRDEEKIRKKIDDVRIDMATDILFGRYLRQEENRKKGMHTITDFFKRR